MNQIAVILTDAEHRILWVNREFEHMTGYRFEEVAGRVPGQVLQGPGTEPDAVERIRAGLKGDVPFRDALTNYRKNGEPFICKLVIYPIFDRYKSLVNFLAFEVDGSKVKDENQIPLFNLGSRYRTSSLRGTEELRLYERIRSIFETEAVYLDPNLNLRRLADLLETNTKYLSQVINHFSGNNFLTFVNGFRIAKVKERIREDEHLSKTFFGIAQQCGFKNKSTFYKVFRDMTGQTPKSFVDQMANETNPTRINS